eukprot:15447152-Alexandrium_andersonii.AAC.1
MGPQGPLVLGSTSSERRAGPLETKVTKPQHAAGNSEARAGTPRQRAPGTTTDKSCASLGERRRPKGRRRTKEGNEHPRCQTISDDK